MSGLLTKRQLWRRVKHQNAKSPNDFLPQYTATMSTLKSNSLECTHSKVMNLPHLSRSVSAPVKRSENKGKCTREKRVSFDQALVSGILLIPAVEELLETSSKTELWWSAQDCVVFKQEATSELEDMMNLYANLGPRLAIKYLYQPGGTEY